MRLINSGDVNKLLDDKTDPGELFDFDDDISSPCWEVKVDRENNKFLFLIDGEEVFTAPSSNFDESEITIDLLVHFIHLLKENDFAQIKKETSK